MSIAESIEIWTSIVANIFAVGAIVLGWRPIRSWSESVRDELVEVRRELAFPDRGEGTDIVLRHQQLRVTGRTDNNLKYNISWGSNAKTDLARISARHLRRRLGRNDNCLNTPIVADLRFFRPSNDQSAAQQLEVTKLHYVEDGSLVSRIRKLLLKHNRQK